MEILIGIIVIWLFWAGIKGMQKSKKMVNDLSDLRIAVLKEPEGMLEQLGFLDLDIGEGLEKNVANKLKGLMIQRGHSVNDYFPSLNDSSFVAKTGGNVNLEVMNTFAATQHDICEQIRKYSDQIV